MRKLSILGLICFLILSSTACFGKLLLPVRVISLNDTPARAMVNWRLVKIFRTADEVKDNYEELALLAASWGFEKIDVTKKHPYASENLWNALKKKAARIGANAIILDSTSVSLVDSGHRKGKAVAIFIYPGD